MQDVRIKYSNKDGWPCEVCYSQEPPSLKTMLEAYFEKEDALRWIYDIKPIFQNEEIHEIQNNAQVEKTNLQFNSSNSARAVVQQKNLTEKLPIAGSNDIKVTGYIKSDLHCKPKRTFDLWKKFVTYCNRCKESFRDSNLENVKECGKCNGQMITRCLKCNLRFRKYHKIVEHFGKNCKQESLHNCSYCDYTTYIKTHLFSHLKNRHSIENFSLPNKKPGSALECSKCGKNCENYASLRKHEKSCSEASCKCSYCQYSSNYPNLLGKHLRTAHGKLLSEVKKSEKSPFLYGNDLNEIDEKSKFNVKEKKNESAKLQLTEEERNRLNSLIETRCVNCNTVNTSDNLPKHHIQCQQANDMYCCLYPKCGMTYSKSFNLQRHIIIGHLSGSISKQFKCPKCGKTFGYQRNMRDHNKICGLQKTQPDLNCKYCEFKTKTIRYLNRHTMTVHRNLLTESYSCKECSQEFVTMSSFEYHQKRCYKPVVVDIED